MKNTSILSRSLAYLLAVVAGGLIVVVAEPATQQVSRFVTLPAGVESTLDKVGLNWRPTGEAAAPCGPLGFRIDATAQGTAPLIRTALAELATLSGLEFVEVTGEAFITFETVDAIRSPEGLRALGVAETTTRWDDGRAVIDHSVVQLSREAMTTWTPDFTPQGYGWTILHEAAHTLGVEHLDNPGAVMAAARSHAGVLTDADRAAIAAAGAGCYR